MYTLYGESWDKYVVVKPPWTAASVLKCAVKHWIAAISESFQRKAEVILKELFEIFENATGNFNIISVPIFLFSGKCLLIMKYFFFRHKVFKTR